jgi:hypothetical protein
LREKLVRYLRKNESPNKGPFLIKLIESERTEFSWEEFARKQLKKFGNTVKEIKAMVKVAKARAGASQVDTLKVEVNPDWKN